MMVLMSLFGIACSRPSHGADDLPAPAEDFALAEEAGEKTIVLAGGCFWCTEAVFEQLEGVTDVVSGYAGGTQETANYEMVANGVTDHAEAIAITYDPAKLTFGQLLRVFFTAHDPTTLNAQGADKGRQYRSAVFYADEDEKRVAGAYIQQLNDAEAFSDPIVTTLEPLEAFYLAEQYHQDFVQKHPNHPYVRVRALPKVKKVRSTFSAQVKPLRAK